MIDNDSHGTGNFGFLGFNIGRASGLADQSWLQDLKDVD